MNILFTPSDNNSTSGAFRSMVALRARLTLVAPPAPAELRRAA